MVDMDDDPERAVKSATADSFAYEWEHFGGLRPEWQHNFRGYLQPLEPEALAGRLVLDVGAGSGRHSHQAARFGAQVVAVDVGSAIDVARANLPDDVLCVQADAERLPFAEHSFDVVLSIGVLHHLPDPERAVRTVARHVRPGGRLQLYLYWQPERRWQRAVLRGVSAARRVTTRLPFGVLRALCLPLSAALWACVVAPHRIARRQPGLRRLSAWLPLKAYADYPFGVLLNDQFDRLSAPLERRFTAAEVRALLASAGLEEITVVPHHGWVAGGRMPERP
jgi:SAM-dependent methyltransferase